MRTDSIDVNSLVSYINDIKPFHSKLTEVTVEYQANDNIYVALKDEHEMSMELSSIWELHRVSDGIRTQYRIPAAVFPRYSEDTHQSTRIGVTDEVPGSPGSYCVPYNNGVEVKVNGQLKTVNVDYVIDTERTTVTFINNSIPILGDVVNLNWSVIDRVFIGLGNPVVWQEYNLEFSSAQDGMDMIAYDISGFDSAHPINPELFFLETSIKVDPFGKVKVIPDNTGKLYYVFEFYSPLPLDMSVWIRVEQRDSYNGWTQTRITEEVLFADKISFYDDLRVWVVDPETWNVNLPEYDPISAETLFGIDISNGRNGFYDIEAFDLVGYDSVLNPITIGYYPWIRISEFLSDSMSVTNTDSYKDTISLVPNDLAITSITEKTNKAITVADTKQINVSVMDNKSSAGYPNILVDSDVADEMSATYISDTLSIVTTTSGNTVYTGVYRLTDANGTVYVTTPASRIEIFHNYGYNPFVVVYLGNEQLMPSSISYPQIGVVVITLSAPRNVVVRLV